MRIGQVRPPLLVLLLLVVGATLVIDGSSSSASSACAFNASTGVATVTISGPGTTTVRRSGLTLRVDGATCGAVGTVDTIALNGDADAQTLVVDLSGGPLGPGKTAEPAGTSEIELVADLGTVREDTISVVGTSGADTVHAGDGGINLNGDDDADLTGPGAGALASTGIGALALDGAATGDVLSGAGGTGTGAPVPHLIAMTILGRNGADTITGGHHDDEITGGAGDDTEDGGGGNDTFFQGPVPDGADTLIGGDQPTDRVDYSQRQADVTVTLAGAADDGASGEGDDVNAEVEQVTGGAGDDTIVADQALFRAVTFYGQDGNDTLTLGDQSDVAYGGTGNDTIHARAGTDWLVNGPGDDIVFGEEGSDTFFEDESAPGVVEEFGNGADDLRGGLGHDIVTYRNRDTRVVVTMGDNVANDGHFLFDQDNVRSDVEELIGGGGGGNDITGNALDNVLRGSGYGDDISGLGGDDLIEGSGGDDELWGGSGDDTVFAGFGADEVRGDSGADDLWGDGGNDDVHGGADADVVRGGDGADTLDEDAAPNGADDLTGGDGVDTISYAGRVAPVSVSIDGAANDGAAGELDGVRTDVENILGGKVADTLVGGSGANTITGNGGADQIDGAGGVDTASYSSRTVAVEVSIDGIADDGAAGEGDNVLTTIENVEGGTRGDDLRGSAAVNRLWGNGGADTLDGGPGADLLDGGAALDTATYAARTARVVVTIGAGANDGEAAERDNVTAETERVLGGDGNDTLVGSSGDEVLVGGDGNDLLDGRTGADSLAGSTGRDTATYATRTEPVSVTLNAAADDGAAGEGDRVTDTVEDVVGGSGPDTLTGSGAANLLNGGGGDDTLDGGPDEDVLRGGAGIDTATYAARSAPVIVDLNGAADDGEAGEGDNAEATVENVRGGTGPDTLSGGGGANALDGGPGGDTLAGRNGDDVLDGGTGTDQVSGGGGAHDVASYASREAPVTILLGGGAASGEPGENDTVDADVEDARGGAGGDTITGSGQANVLDGGPGDDRLRGEGGPDVLTGGDDVDTADYSTAALGLDVSLDGSANDGVDDDHDGVSEENDDVDTENVTGGTGKDFVTGDGGPNVLGGGLGDDGLDGAGGNDVIAGGEGDDILMGKEGDDTFGEGTAANGSDFFLGGNGRDLVSYSGRSADLVVKFDGVDNDGASGENDNVLTAVERVDAGRGDDLLEGDAGPNDLYGGVGDDEIWGRAGDDLLRGASGEDELHGEDDDDTFFGGQHDDALDGGNGNDTVNAGPGNDTAGGGDGDDTVHGDDGNDVVGTGDNPCCDFTDIAFGDGGDDVLNAEGSVSDLVGGPGADTFNSSFALSGSHGAVLYDDRTTRVSVTIDGVANDGAAGENDNVMPGIKKVVSGSGDDSLTGDNDENTLAAGPGVDEVFGRGGDDNLGGGPGDDTVSGGGGRDQFCLAGLGGDAGRDVFTGNAGWDTFCVKDGEVDDVDGGPDTDDGTFDAGDVVVNVP